MFACMSVCTTVVHADCVRAIPYNIPHTHTHVHTYMYIHVHTVCVQIFAGLYLCEFHESMGVHENENTKICTHMVQVGSCRLPFTKLNLRKLLGVGCS